MNAAKLQKYRLENIALMRGALPVKVEHIEAVVGPAEILLARLVHQDGVGVKEVEAVRAGLDALWAIHQKLNQEGK